LATSRGLKKSIAILAILHGLASVFAAVAPAHAAGTSRAAAATPNCSWKFIYQFADFKCSVTGGTGPVRLHVGYQCQIRDDWKVISTWWTTDDSRYAPGTFSETCGLGTYATDAWVEPVIVSPPDTTPTPDPVIAKITNGDLDSPPKKCADDGGLCPGNGRYMYGAGVHTTSIIRIAQFRCGAFGFDPAPGVTKVCRPAPPHPPGYQKCAEQYGACASHGIPRDVAYGYNGVYTHKITADDVTCSNDTFGDPFPSYGKDCWEAPATPDSSGTYGKCADEGAVCTAPSGAQLIFGAYGSYKSLSATGDTPCTSEAFGDDPLPTVGKACWYRTGPPPGMPTAGGHENSPIYSGAARTAAYGNYGVYVIRTISDTNASCSNETFGTDPLPGVGKQCWLMD
jgi:hypothetical protein